MALTVLMGGDPVRIFSACSPGTCITFSPCCILRQSGVHFLKARGGSKQRWEVFLEPSHSRGE